MKILSLLLFFHTGQGLFAIGAYQPGDTLYVWAVSGLILREGPATDAKKLMVVPYGTAIVVQGYSGAHQTKIEAVPSFKGREEINPPVILEGDFAQVTFKGKTGYLFDGYLSKLPAFRYSFDPGSNQPAFESEADWATRNFGLVSKKQTGNFEYGFPWSKKWIFGNGISINSWGEKSGQTRIILPDISMEEVFLMFSYLNNYEWTVRHPSGNPLDYPWHFKKEQANVWSFSNEVCGFKIQFLPGEHMAIMTSECSC